MVFYYPLDHTPTTTHNVISVYCIILVHCGIGRKILLDLPRKKLSSKYRTKLQSNPLGISPDIPRYLCHESPWQKGPPLASWVWYWPPKFLSRTGWDFTVQLNIVLEWQRQTATNSPRSFYIKINMTWTSPFCIQMYCKWRSRHTKGPLLRDDILTVRFTWLYSQYGCTLFDGNPYWL